MKELVIAFPLIVLGVGSILPLLSGLYFRQNSIGYALSFIVLGGTLLTTLIFSTNFAGESEARVLLLTDGLANASMFLILGMSLLCLFLISPRALEAQNVAPSGDFYALFLMSVFGSVLLVQSGELITFFVAFEIMSMALYCLVGSANKAIVATATTAISGTKDTVTAGGGVSVLQIPLAERFSAEASLKYFLLGSFSSAFLLYGIALFYGYSGSTFIADIPPTLSTGGITTLTPYLLALSFLCLGFFFKLGSVPFHYWTPDVYEGAPTGITTYMASTIKCVATLIMIRFVLQIYPQAEVSGAIWSVAVATLLVGNVIALRQFSVKRMLAYSSIAHVGYILMGVLSATPYEGNSRSVAAVIFYLLGYSITTIGAFAILSIVERNNKGNSDLDTFRTLKSNSPFMAGMFTLFMFSLAGLPPGLVGLVGKFLVFNESVRAGYVGLAIVGAIGSAISIYYYLKVVMVIYFNESEKTYSVKDSVEKSYTVSPHTLNPYGVTFTERLVILGCSLGVIFTGIFCSPILQLMSRILEG